MTIMSDENSELLNSAPVLEANEKGFKKINNAKIALEKLFRQLAQTEFNREAWISDFSSYVSTFDKLYYSVISGIILKELDDNSISLLLSHITTVIEYKDVSDELYKPLLKFYDHCNLAYAQKTVYQTTKHEAETTVSNTLKEKLDDYQKDMTGQLIGLISIFTALAFLVFGSISILDNLLTNVQSQPLFKVLFVADLWLLCMTNMFMIFARVIGKFTKTKIDFSLYYGILNIVMGVIAIAMLMIHYREAINKIFLVIKLKMMTP